MDAEASPHLLSSTAQRLLRSGVHTLFGFLLGLGSTTLLGAQTTTVPSELAGWFQLAPEEPDGKTPFAVQGWVVATCGPAEASVTVDEDVVWRGEPFTAWPGVVERYPDVKGADHAGFWMQIDPTRFVVGEHQIDVSVEACGQSRAVGSATFRTTAATSSWIAWPILILVLIVLPAGVGRFLANRQLQSLTISNLGPKIGALYLVILTTIVVAPQLGQSAIAVDGGGFASLANWDGRFYIDLATSGYSPDKPTSYAFFPLYPLWLRTLSLLPIPLELIGALANIGLFLLLISLLRRLYPQADHGIAIFACLPFAFFFVATYTETLALVLGAGFVLALRRDRWALALLLGVLAGLTRITCLPLALFAIDFLRRRQWRQAVVALAAPTLGLGGWMLWLWQQTGDAMRFLTVQAEFGRTTPFHPGRLLDLLSAALTSGRWQTYWELAFLFLVLIGAASLAARGRWSAAAYSGAVALMPLYTMRLAALNRYALLAFPAWVLLGSHLGDRLFFRVFVALELLALTFLAARFGQQFWVG